MTGLDILYKVGIESAKELKLQDKIIREMADFLFHNYYKYTYVDEFQYEEKIQEIIDYFTKKVDDIDGRN